MHMVSMDKNSQDNQEYLDEINLERPLKACLKCSREQSESWLYRQLRVCPYCRFHHSITARRRIATLADSGSFKETNVWISSLDPLEFSLKASYNDELEQDRARTGLKEAAVTGICTIGGIKAVLIILDFGFRGGSMGVAVGEKIALAFELAARRKIACVSIITSGGVRLQEGMLSLTQMAKTLVAAEKLHKAAGLSICVLGNPATGQVLASFASQADIVLAEPGARIGFAPMRAVQDAESEELGEDEYSSEAFLQAGQIDRVTDREHLKHELATFMDMRYGSRLKTTSQVETPISSSSQSIDPQDVLQAARHKDRPRSADYIDYIITNFMQLHGDKLHRDDPSVIAGIGRLGGEVVTVIAQQKGVHTLVSAGDGDVKDFRGEISPAGLRKASRTIKISVKFGLPLISFIDTHGFGIGRRFEFTGLASAISGLLTAMLTAEIPTVSVIIGEGHGEAALAFGVTDRVLMLENAVYMTTSQGEIDTRRYDAEPEEEVMQTLITANECVDAGIVDSIVQEPKGGAHIMPIESARLLKMALIVNLAKISESKGRSLAKSRRKKFRSIGEQGGRVRNAVANEVRAWQAALKTGARMISKGSNADSSSDAS